MNIYKVLLRKSDGTLCSPGAVYEALRLFYREGETTQTITELWDTFGLGIFVFTNLEYAVKYADNDIFEVWKVEAIGDLLPVPKKVFWACNQWVSLQEIEHAIKTDTSTEYLSDLCGHIPLEGMAMVKSVRLIEKMEKI